MNAELDRVRNQTGQHASRARKPVLAHPQVVTSGAAQRDVSDRAVRAREREPLGDFRGGAAIGTWSALWHDYCPSVVVRATSGEDTSAPAVAGGDLCDRADRDVDVRWGVVEVEAEAAAGRRIEAQRMVGEGCAMTAAPGLHAGVIQLSREGQRVMTRQIERDKRGAPAWIGRSVDGDARDYGELVKGAPGQDLIPSGDAGHRLVYRPGGDGLTSPEVDVPLRTDG